MFKQLVQGLYDLFKLNIMHRDIKLANIFLTSDDIQTANVKLGDFGLATYSNLAKTQCGSPLYEAPEIRTAKTYNY